MSNKQTLQDAAPKKDRNSLRARAEAFDEQMRQVKGSRPTIQEVVEECRIVRKKMYKERLNGHA